MPARCEVCAHPDLRVLDAELHSGKSLPLLSRMYDLEESTLRRHKREHLNAVSVVQGTDPVSQLRDLDDFINNLQVRLRLGTPLRLDGQAVPEVGSKDFALLGPMYLRSLELRAKLTHADHKPDWRDVLPQWRRIEKVLMEYAQGLPDEAKNQLYVLLEEAERAAEG